MSSSSHQSAASPLHQELAALFQATKEADGARAGGNEAKVVEWQRAADQHRMTIRTLLQPRRMASVVDPLNDLELIERALKKDDPRAVLCTALGLDDEQRRAVPVPEIRGQRPDRLLSVVGKKGALLSVGGVLVLAGEGGVAKSPLALSIALAMAARPGNTYGDLHGGLFEGIGGPALVASYEDWPAVSADRLRKLADLWWPATEANIGTRALRRVHVLDVAGRPLFGPVTHSDSGCMSGWDDLWSEAKRTGARVVVIDPALSAYVSDANNAAPVREFMGALAGEAVTLQCGVVLVAHSRKSARDGRNNRSDSFDPGHVAGSTHWTDAARGVLTLTYGDNAGTRVLAVSKANYGPSQILCRVAPIRASSGEICGFGSDGNWDHRLAQGTGNAGKHDEKAGTAGLSPTELEPIEL